MNTDQLTTTAKNLSTGNKILGGSALVALVAANLPWYQFNAAFGLGGSIAGRRFGFGWMGLLLLIAAAGLILAPAFGGKAVEAGKLKTEQLGLVAAGLGALFWLIRLASTPGSLDRAMGLYVAILAAGGVIYGVIASMKEKGIAMPTLDDVKTVTASSTTASPSATAPSPYPAGQYAPPPAPHAPAPQASAPQAPAPQAPTSAQPPVPHNSAPAPTANVAPPVFPAPAPASTPPPAAPPAAASTPVEF